MTTDGRWPFARRGARAESASPNGLAVQRPHRRSRPFASAWTRRLPDRAMRPVRGARLARTHAWLVPRGQSEDAERPDHGAAPSRALRPARRKRVHRPASIGREGPEIQAWRGGSVEKRTSDPASPRPRRLGARWRPLHWFRPMSGDVPRRIDGAHRRSTADGPGRRRRRFDQASSGRHDPYGMIGTETERDRRRRFFP